STVYILKFFFSRRSRHTRFSRDWSSDVCSSDLAFGFQSYAYKGLETGSRDEVSYVLKQDKIRLVLTTPLNSKSSINDHIVKHGRSEERRVGKERRSRREARQYIRKECTLERRTL